jgi:ATP-binding cassette subfamily B protein
MAYQYTYIQDKKFDTKGNLLPFLKRIFRYTLRYKKWFGVFMLAIMAIAISDAIYPLIWMYYLDTAIIPMAREVATAQQSGVPLAINWSQIYTFIAIFLGNGILQVTCVYFFIRYAGRIEESVMYDLRREMFVKLQALSFSFYDRSAAGWLLSRISSDTPRVTRLISWSFLECAWGITMIFCCFVAMFWYNWRLALILLAAMPVFWLVSDRIRSYILHYSRQGRKLNSEATAAYSEHINGIEVNKITVQEQRVSNEFAILTSDLRHASFYAAFYTAMYMPIILTIGSVAAVIILYRGGLMTLEQSLSIGTLSTFFNYALQIFWPIMEISRFYAEAQGSLSAGERIFSLIDEQPDIIDKKGATDFDTIKGDVSFENVDFHYLAKKPVLSNFNLHIKAGQSVALVGATGGGKSTIINLICRFYEPTGGILKIDGINYLDRSIYSLRKQLGVVLQTPHLFSGTIRDNIRYAKLDATDAEIIESLQYVGAEQFATRLDEKLAENGDNLSMGEKQLLSFARALLVNPRLLIMDEATASIDSLTEARIQQGIEKMIANRTALIVAHRLSTIRHCNRILVIKKGSIIEDGTHQQLMQQRGYYYNLYTTQLQEQTAQLNPA